jgi:hypothetical protein
MNIYKKIGFICLSFFCLNYCGTQEDTIKPQKAYGLLITSIAYKKSECGNEPVYPLPMPPKPIEYAVNACAYSIIKTHCPFLQYPVVCLEIYKKEIRGTKDLFSKD